ncbi:MAG: type II toxin-antitoxin system VapC family toxin [Nitrospinae bacterium]|nr:type II toxin-antitoxin system VapC family toxin [Nitrospinota bacterium]
MILLDTNVVSELMRSSPDPAVEAWVAGHSVEELFFSAVGEAELRYGVAVMPTGRRRERLAYEIEAMLHEDFGGRVLPFDSEAARAYAEVASVRRAAGRPAPLADCQIAAIARSQDMAVATRNVRDFTDMGVDLIDPWIGV